jgi:excisionase family DNA binding protein
MILLNTNEAAKELRVHPITIRRLISNGKIDYHRLGKKIFFTPENIEQYVKRCSIPAKGAE